MMKAFKVLYCLCLLSSLSYAQEALTLENAINYGLKNNYDIQISRINKDIALNNNNWGEAGRYPRITLNGTNRNSILERDNPTSFVNGTLRSSSLNGTLDAAWVIFGGFKVNRLKTQLSLLYNQSEMQQALVIENTTQAIALAYNRVLIEAEKLKILEYIKTLSKDRYHYEADKQSSGLSSSFNVIQFENAYLDDSSNVILQELNIRNAKRNLNLLLARDINTEFNCTDSLSIVINTLNTDSLRENILKNNQQLQLEFINMDLLKNNKLIAESDLYPTLSLNLGSILSESSFNLEGAGSGSGSSLEYYANFTLSYTLFNGGKIRRAIKNSEWNIESGQLKVDQMTLSLDNQIISQIDLYNTRSEILNIRRDQEKQTAKNLELADARIRTGLINSFDFRDIQLSYLRSKLNALQAIFDLYESSLEIKRLTGELFSIKK